MRRLPHLLLALLLAVTLVACGDDGGSTQDEDEGFDPPSTTEAPGTTDENTVIFSTDEVDTDARGEPTTWTPSPDDVAAADELLQQYLEDHPELDLDDFDTYRRQYVGTGPDDGELVSVNALCESSGLDDWQDDLIVVSDGGTCFWQADVFVPNGIVSNFAVNGYA